MKRNIVLLSLICITLANTIAQNDKDNFPTQISYDWKDSMSYAERELWVKSIMNQHYQLMAKEPSNFDSLRPFFINNIQECGGYYAIEVIDPANIFHYTVVSPKTKKNNKRSKKDITIGSVYYLKLFALTSYTGIIGCSEVLYGVSFEIDGKTVRYISSDVLYGPPVCTENLNGLRYVKKRRKSILLIQHDID